MTTDIVASVDTLTSALKDADSVAQDASDKACAIGRALVALVERDCDKPRLVEAIEQLVHMMVDSIQCASNDINARAGEVGADWVEARDGVKHATR